MRLDRCLDGCVASQMTSFHFLAFDDFVMVGTRASRSIRLSLRGVLPVRAPLLASLLECRRRIGIEFGMLHAEGGLRARVVDPARKWLYYGGKLNSAPALLNHSRLPEDGNFAARLHLDHPFENPARCNPPAPGTVLGPAPA